MQTQQPTATPHSQTETAEQFAHASIAAIAAALHLSIPEARDLLAQTLATIDLAGR